MAVNKVVLGNTTVMDITDTTATADDVASGKIFYTKDGAQTTGTASGGSSSWEFISSKEIEVNQTSTSQTQITTIALGKKLDTSKILYVRIRDKAGKRAGYFLGTDNFYINYLAANGATGNQSTIIRLTHTYDTSNKYVMKNNSYGVYAGTITTNSTNATIYIYAKYSSTNSLTINGTYKVDLYLLDYPDGVSVFDI